MLYIRFSDILTTFNTNLYIFDLLKVFKEGLRRKLSNICLFVHKKLFPLMLESLNEPNGGN